jgi:hypothetical protein
LSRRSLLPVESRRHVGIDEPGVNGDDLRALGLELDPNALG